MRARAAWVWSGLLIGLMALVVALFVCRSPIAGDALIVFVGVVCVQRLVTFVMATRFRARLSSRRPDLLATHRVGSLFFGWSYSRLADIALDQSLENETDLLDYGITYGIMWRLPVLLLVLGLLSGIVLYVTGLPTGPQRP